MPSNNKQDTTEGASNIVTRSWKMKAGKGGVPDHLHEQRVNIRVVGQVSTWPDFVASVKTLTGDNLQAAVDTFNSAAALAFQKAIKAEATAESKVDQLQASHNAAVLTPNQRGGSGKTAQRERQKAKAEQLDNTVNRVHEQLEALKASDPAKYEEQRALFESLGLL